MKTFISFVFLFVPLLCSAKSPSEHMLFMGMPIAGSAECFITKLEEKGFVKSSEYETLYTFHGKFANEFVELSFLASPITKTVCKVIIYFPEKTSWDKLKADYFEKKELYRSKYLLSSEFEFFIDPYDEGDGYELQAVALEKCKYYSFFKDTEGGIVLSICPQKSVKVTYEDTKNMKIAKQEFESKAFDDI